MFRPLRLALLSAAAFLPLAPAAAAPEPKLVVMLAVDQLSADLFEAYRPHFTGGLARLSQGIVYARGYQAHAGTSTCPGHATMLTGAHPARSGVVANRWHDPDAPRADKRVYCAEDPRVPGTTSADHDYTVSAHHLRVPALGDHMRHAFPGARTVSVSGKDRAAVMLGGLAPEQRWHWREDRFVETSGHPARLAGVAANERARAALARPGEARPVPPLCGPRAAPVTLAGGRVVGTGRFAREAGDLATFRIGPELDEATVALAADLAEEMRLGHGAQPDLLAISLSSTDYVGHAYGAGGGEMCIHIHALDAAVGHLLERLDGLGLPYVVALTADHGAPDIPERIGGARMDRALAPAALGARLAGEFGLEAPVFVPNVGDTVYRLAPSVSGERRDAILRRAAELLRADPQTETVLTADEIAARPLPSGDPSGWSTLDMARASWFPGRSGDLLRVLREDVSAVARPSLTSAVTHGTPWSHDRQVPILFWWNGIAGETRTEAAMTVDILPTLAPLIDLSLEGVELDGACRPLPGSACPPAP